MQAGHRARWRVAFTKVTHPLFHSLEEVVSKAFAAEISRCLALPPSNAAPATPLERWLARSDRFGIFHPPRSRRVRSAPKSRRSTRNKRMVVVPHPDHLLPYTDTRLEYSRAGKDSVSTCNPWRSPS